MNWKLAGRLFVFAWFAIGGTCHFVIVEPFLRIMPPYVPWPQAAVYLSGAFELLGAFGILLPYFRSLAGYGLMLLAAIVTLANVQMLQHPELFPAIPYWMLVARFPVQALLIWISWRSTRPDGTPAAKPDSGEWVEIGLVVAITLACWQLAAYLPSRLPLGNLLLYLSALLLAQSLLRDLWLLVLARNSSDATRSVARCMCVESMLGASGTLAGLIVLGAGLDVPLTMDAERWTVSVFLVLATGFVLKDLVFELSPLHVRRDKHHMNIIVAWKNP